MYYLITKYEIPVCATARKVIAVINKYGFKDLYDYHPLDSQNKIHIMSEEDLKDFMKDGFLTVEEASDTDDLQDALYEFVGPFFNGTFEVISESQLIQKYKEVSNG